MANSESDLTSALRRPLCQRYALGIPGAAVVRLRDAAGFREESLYWVLGWLVDGECEPLGVCVGAQALPRMMADLKTRGAQRIWHVAARVDDGGGQAGEVAARALTDAFPGALASSRPHVLPIAEAVAKDVRTGLIRAIRRRGHFDSGAAALDFVAHALQRAERRLDRERLAARERSPIHPDARTASAAV